MQNSIFFRSRRSSESNDDVTEVITLDPDSDSEDIVKRKRICLASPSTSSASTSQQTMCDDQLQKTIENEEHIKSITKFLVGTLQPVSIINDASLKLFTFTLNAKYKFPLIDDIESGLTFEYELIRSKIEDRLKVSPFVSLSTESWKSFLSDDLYVTVRAHFIDDKWIMHTHVLSTCRLSKSNSKLHLNERLNEIIKTWNLQEKIVSITYDSPDYMDTNVSNTNIICLAYVLQRCLNESIEQSLEAKRLIEKCQILVDHFHDDRVADVYLVKYQKSIEVPNVALCQINVNEFNSLFKFLKTLVDQKTTISAVLNDDGATPKSIANAIRLTDDEWLQLQNILTILQPFDLAKSIMFKEDNIEGVASLTTPLIDTLCQNFFQQDAKDGRLINELKMSICLQLRKQYPNMYKYSDADTTIEPDFYDIAMYLDPHYKSLSCLNDCHRKKIWEYVDSKINIKSNGCDMGQCSSPRAKVSNKHRNAIKILFPSTSTDKSSPIQLGVECSQYNLEPEIDKTLSNICEWWEMREKAYPLLSMEAKRYLCARATSKPLYSYDTFYERRATLPPRHIDQFLFLYNNR